jgi:hypothetical protein
LTDRINLYKMTPYYCHERVYREKEPVEKTDGGVTSSGPGGVTGGEPPIRGGDGRPRSGLEAGVGLDPQVCGFLPFKRHRINQWLAAGFLVFLLVSCKSQAKFSQYAPVSITDRKNYFLLPPEAIEKPLDMPQQISGRYGEQEFIMDCWVQANDRGITIALFNSFGTEAGYLAFTGEAVSFFSSVFPSALKAEYIVADFQFCFYRVDLLSQALKDSGLRLVVEIRDGIEESQEVRTIFSGKKPLVEIVKTGSSVFLKNFLRDYSYTLRGIF